MKKYCFMAFMIVIFLLGPIACNAVRINEIMYNPAGDDNNMEFIEVEMDEYADLTGWTIGDSESDDTLTMLQDRQQDGQQGNQSGSYYALIVEEGFDFSAMDSAVYSAGASIGNNLGNSADSVTLYRTNGSMVDSASYDSTLANGNGRSIELFMGLWVESCDIGGSPGNENHKTCGGDYDGEGGSGGGDSGGDSGQNASINRTGSINGSINGTGWINDTGSQYQEGNDSSDDREEDEEICRPIIVAYTDKEIYNATDKVNIYFALYNRSFPFTIEYWIEDSAGKTVKSRYNTTNLNTKTWTPALDEIDGVFYLKSRLYLECPSGMKQGSSESMIIIFNNGPGKSSESEMIIKEIYVGTDDKIEFGQPLRLNVEVYKGDEDKSAVEFWVERGGEKASQTTKALFYDKFRSYDLTIPIQLYSNCKGDYPDGSYTLVAEGLGLRKEEAVNIEGFTSSLCPSDPDSGTKTAASGSGAGSSSGQGKEIVTKTAEQKITYQLLNFNREIEAEKEVSNELLIQNDGSEHSFEVWSYVYRGSKCYSGERESNRQNIELSAGESAMVELLNVVEKAEPGDYKLKVKVKKDSQKTNYEITKDVTIVSPAASSETAAEGKTQVDPDVKTLAGGMKKLAGSAVYEGSGRSSRGIGLVFLLLSAFTLVLLGAKRWLWPAGKASGRAGKPENKAGQPIKRFKNTHPYSGPYGRQNKQRGDIRKDGKGIPESEYHNRDARGP